MLRFAVIGVVFTLLVGLFWVGLGLNPRELPSPLIGKPAPAFRVPELFDPAREISNTDLKDKVTLVNVWASWCSSCRSEHRHLLTLRRQGVRLVGLNYKDERAAAFGYLNAGGNPYEVIGFDESGAAGIEWGVYGTPETFVIDRQGVVRYKHVGPLNEVVIRDTLLPLIAELERT
ncbi:MAG: DsbE family thiol:disulfide interchange protein [Thiohalomonadaceae bacterium]